MGAGKEKSTGTHKQNLYLKDDKQINCKNSLYLPKPPGAFQMLTALVMLHCPSKGHTQQIALAMVQKQALLE